MNVVHLKALKTRGANMPVSKHEQRMIRGAAFEEPELDPLAKSIIGGARRLTIYPVESIMAYQASQLRLLADRMDGIMLRKDLETKHKLFDVMGEVMLTFKKIKDKYNDTKSGGST